jgi:hypothetical protein
MDGALATPDASGPQPDWVPRRRLTVQDYHRMGEAGILGRDDRVELIEGELVAMSPVGGPHIVRVMKLTRLLVGAVGDRAIVSVQSPIRLGGFSEPEPDLALVRLPAERYLASPPTPPDIFLVMEVADTTLRYDSAVKAALYARHGIAAFWLLDLAAGTVLLHGTPRDGGYADIMPAATDAVLEIAGLPGLQLPVRALLA